MGSRGCCSWNQSILRLIKQNQSLESFLGVGSQVIHKQWTFGSGKTFWSVLKFFPAEVETLYFHFNLYLKCI